MFKLNLKKIAYSAFVFLIILGAISAASHYLPQPSTEVVMEFNPPPGKEWFLEQRPQYDAHPMSEFLHIIPAVLFLLIIPFQLSKRLRQSKPRLHRYLGRSFVLLGLVMGLAGLYIGLVYPFAGIKESIFVVPFSVLFLFSLYKGFVYARQKRFDLHKKWMFVSVAVGFTPVTMRFIFSPYIFFTGISGREVFVETMVIGLLVNLVVLRLYWSKQQNRSRLGKLSSNILSDKQA